MYTCYIYVFVYACVYVRIYMYRCGLNGVYEHAEHALHHLRRPCRTIRPLHGITLQGYLAHKKPLTPLGLP